MNGKRMISGALLISLIFLVQSFISSGYTYPSTEKTQINNTDLNEILCLMPLGPCNCSTEPSGIRLNCDAHDVRRIYHAFHAIIEPVIIDRLTISNTKMGDDTEIPEDLLGHSTARAVIVENKQMMDDTRPVLTIARNAFKSSTKAMLTFKLEGFHAHRLDWSFLEAFTDLNELWLIRLANVGNMTRTLSQFNSNLTLLHFDRITMLDDLPNAPVTLKTARFERCSSRTATISNFVTRLVPAAGSLREISFSGSPLVQVPHELRLFRQLNWLGLSGTGLHALRVGDFKFDAGPKTISLGDNNISSIEPGTFDDKDSFAEATVYMLGNSLETFDENVFKVFLENGGALDFFNTNLNCDCDIAWLIVKRRELLKNANVWCRSNTLISELHAEKFEHCFILETVSSSDSSTDSPLSEKQSSAITDNLVSAVTSSLSAYHVMVPAINITVRPSMVSRALTSTGEQGHFNSSPLAINGSLVNAVGAFNIFIRGNISFFVNPSQIPVH